MLKGKFKSSYLRNSKKDGVTRRIYVYEIDGTQEEVDAFIAAQDEALENGAIRDEVSGKPLFFSTRQLPKNIKLTVTQNNKVAVDLDTDPIAQAEAIVGSSQNPILQAAIANNIASKMVQGLNFDFGGGNQQGSMNGMEDLAHEEETPIEEEETMEGALGNKKTTTKK